MRLSLYFFNRSNLNFSVKIFTYFLKIIYHTYVRFIKINLNWLLLLTILYSRFYRFAIVEMKIKLNFRKIDILGEIIKPRPPLLLLLLFLKSVKKKKKKKSYKTNHSIYLTRGWTAKEALQAPRVASLHPRERIIPTFSRDTSFTLSRSDADTTTFLARNKTKSSPMKEIP